MNKKLFADLPLPGRPFEDDLEKEDFKRRVRNILCIRSLQYFGSHTKEYLHSLEIETVKLFNYLADRLMGAVVVEIQASFVMTLENGNKQEIRGGGENPGLFQGDRAETPLHDTQFSATLSLSEGVSVLAPVFSFPKTQAEGPLIFTDTSMETPRRVTAIQLGFDWRFLNMSDSPTDRRELQTDIRGIFEYIFEVFQNPDVFKEIVGLLVVQQKRIKELCEDSVFKTRGKKNPKHELELLNVFFCVMAKRLLFSPQVDSGSVPNYEKDLFGVVLFRRCENKQIWYVFTQAQDTYVRRKYDEQSYHTLLQPIPVEYSLTHAVLKSGRAQYFPSWQKANEKFDIESNENVSKEVKKLHALEQDLLGDSIILVPMRRFGFVVAVKVPNFSVKNLSKSRVEKLKGQSALERPSSSVLNVNFLIQSVRFTVNHNSSLFERLHSTLEMNTVEKPLRDYRKTEEGGIEGVFKRKLDYLCHSVASGIFEIYKSLYKLSEISDEEDDAVSRKEVWRKKGPEYFDAIRKSVRFPNILLLGPIGSGRTRVTNLFRQKVQEILKAKYPELKKPFRYHIHNPNREDSYLDFSCALWASNSHSREAAMTALVGDRKLNRKGVLEEVKLGQTLLIKDLEMLHSEVVDILFLVARHRTFTPLNSSDEYTFQGVLVLSSTDPDVFENKLLARISDYVLRLKPLKERENEIGEIIEDLVIPYNHLRTKDFVELLTELVKKEEWHGNIMQLKKTLNQLHILLEGFDLAGIPITKADIRTGFGEAFRGHDLYHHYGENHVASSFKSAQTLKKDQKKINLSKDLIISLFSNEEIAGKQKIIVDKIMPGYHPRYAWGIIQEKVDMWLSNGEISQGDVKFYRPKKSRGSTKK